jgi:signal transduction histidine kinase
LTEAKGVERKSCAIRRFLVLVARRFKFITESTVPVVMKCILTIAALFVAVHSNAVAQASAPSSSITQTTTVAAVTTELTVVKADLEASRRFQEQVLSTVYWSLGVVAALAVLLVGYGWWTNFRVYDRDRQLLDRELRAMVQYEARRIADEQRATADKQAAELSQSLAKAVTTAEAHASAVLKTLVDEALKKIAAQVSQLKDSDRELRNDLRNLQLAAELEKRQKDRSAGSFRNALQGSVTALELAIKTGDEYEIGNVLDFIAEDVNSILGGKDSPVDNFLIGQLVEILDSVKGHHAHAAAALKAKAPALLGK